MPPRIPLIASALRICPHSLTSPPPSRSLLLAFQSMSLHTTPPILNVPARNKTYNPYAIAKSKAIRERNIARQAELAALRKSSHSDPVLGTPTDFLATLDSPAPSLPSCDEITRSRITREELSRIEENHRLNHFLNQQELLSALEHSKKLTFPPPPPGQMRPMIQKEDEFKLAAHSHSVEIVKRITSLSLGSSRDRTRENKQLCVRTFGRHVTDKTLPLDPVHPTDQSVAYPKPFTKTPRVGPDTGSSEVQAAILTAKIRALAEHIKDNKKDKMNKRNLRLLLHKRQKILRYLKRKEKGGVRYRNIMEKLGLDDNAIDMELMM